MPDNADIEYQQKLLSMYRSILAEYLRQRDLWERTKVSGFLRLVQFLRQRDLGERTRVSSFLNSEISVIRDHIVNVKGRLRGWRIPVVDHPDDEDPDDALAPQVQHRLDLLKIHRSNLKIYIQKYEQFGESYVPPVIVHELQNAREEIQRIKAILRGWNIAVEDFPEEE